MTKKAYIYLLGILLLATIPFFLHKYLMRENQLLDKHGKKGICEVYKVKYWPSKDSYAIFYYFYTDYKKFESVDGTKIKSIKPGDKFEVEYLPTNPKINRINYDKPVDKEPQKFNVDSLRRKVIQRSGAVNIYDSTTKNKQQNK